MLQATSVVLLVILMLDVCNVCIHSFGVLFTATVFASFGPR